MRSLTILLALTTALTPMAPLWAQDTKAAEAPAEASDAVPVKDTAKDPAAETGETVDTPAPVLPAITVSSVQTRAMRDVVIASGLVGPMEEVQINPMVQGQQVAELLADVGDMVSAGQVVARLSSSALSLQLSQLSAAIETAKAAGDTAGAAALQGELDSVTADLARAELTIRRTDIKSPVAGEVSARSAELGALAGASGQPMFSIIRDGALELMADVSEADLLRLKTGQKVQLSFVGAQAPISGTVRLVEPSVNAQTRLGRVRIGFDDSSAVRAGMFVEAAVLVAERETLAVPVTALGRYEGENVVMVVKDGEAQRRTVQIGIRESGWIEIVSGLTASETIVTKAGSFVRAGDKINPVLDATN
jgi:HlyD family secretion protein